MELSQRLDLAKLGLDTPSDDDQDSVNAAVTAEGDTLAQLARLLHKAGVVENPETVSAQDTFDSLGIESLSRIELAVRAEDHFGIRVDEESLDPSSTLGEMAQFFDEKATGDAVEKND